MITHLVREGEKLSRIAALYGTSTDVIVDRNQHRPSVQLLSGERVFASLSAGDELLVPRVLGFDIDKAEAGQWQRLGEPPADLSWLDRKWWVLWMNRPEVAVRYARKGHPVAIRVLQAMPEHMVREAEAAADQPGGADHLGLAAGDELVVPPVVGMANPASVYCSELGGELSLSDGACTLPNGTVCKEWTLFRGECPGYPAKYPELANANKPGGWTPAVPETKPEPMISKPMIAGGLAVLGLGLGAVALAFWPKK